MKFFHAQIVGFRLARLRCLLGGLGLLASSFAYGQNKGACDLIPKAELEATLGVSLPYITPTATAVSSSCMFSNKPAGQPNIAYFNVSIETSATPNSERVREVRKRLDENTYDNPIDLPDFADAAFWYGNSRETFLTLFRGGTTVIGLGPAATLDQLKMIAHKIPGITARTGFIYQGPQVSVTKPVLGPLGTKPSQLDQLKHDLAARAEAGSARAQLLLGELYEFGNRGADGKPVPEYSSAAYWYQQAADRGEPRGAYLLSLLVHRGLGVREDTQLALELLRKAALQDYAPAMAPLAAMYQEEVETEVSEQRSIYWTDRAIEKGDSEGWLMAGYQYYSGRRGGEKSVAYRQALDAYKKAAAGGNCVAMMNIGGLYFNGNGVPQNRGEAQDWFTKAEACSGPGLDWVRQKSKTFRERAAAGKLPSPAAVTEAKKLASTQQSTAAGLSLAFIALAIEALKHPELLKDTGTSSGGGSGNSAIDSMNEFQRHQQDAEYDRRVACIYSGGKANSMGCYP